MVEPGAPPTFPGWADRSSAPPLPGGTAAADPLKEARRRAPMAVKFGRPLERKIGFVPVEAESGEVARNPLDLTVRMRRNRQHDWTRRHGARERPHHRRPDLAAVRDGWRQCAAAGAVDAGGRAAIGRSGGARGRARRQARDPLHRAVSLYRPFACATKPAARRSTRTIWSAAPSAPSRRRCRRSACCATWRSIPSPATAMTACCATASSSTTRRSRCWSARRWCRRRPAATSSRRPT